MVRRSQQGDPELLWSALIQRLEAFHDQFAKDEMRERVLALVPAFHKMRDLGASMLDAKIASAEDRILYYFLAYPRTLVGGDELMVVSGIQEFGRRIRKLRVQSGWRIVSGVTLGQMLTEDDLSSEALGIPKLKTNEYLLLDENQDREAAHRWGIANGIRKRKDGASKKLLAYLRENVGKEVTGEELRYVAGNGKEWARRIRELRTQDGWPIMTQVNGRPDLPVGVYYLEAERQAPEHDRKIPDKVRREVMRRDGYACTTCGWKHDLWNRSDPRHLEAHHVIQHKDRGANTPENLTTLCTVCHDEVHGERLGSAFPHESRERRSQ